MLGDTRKAQFLFCFVLGATRDAKKDIENEEMLSRSPRGH